MSPIQQMLLGAGGALADPIYIEDVFKMQIRDGVGTGSSTINNGMDLSGEGGLVWTKSTGGYWHAWYDTARGGSYSLTSNNHNGQASNIAGAVTFNTNGYTIAAGYAENNAANINYVDWVFRKTKGFFDVVTYSGNGTGGRTISHSLGSIPGMIIVKKTSGNEDWTVYHQNVGNEDWLYLNTTNTTQSGNADPWNDTSPTASVFSVGSHNLVNASGSDYVAYLFADNQQTFGGDQDSSIVKCGTYTGSNSTQFINIGWEPQFLLIKNCDTNTQWWLQDSMRGLRDNDGKVLFANLSNAEGSLNFVRATSTGFKCCQANHDETNGSGDKMIYLAIRFPDGYVGKLPAANTSVFAVDTGNGSSSIPTFDSNFIVDFAFTRQVASTGDWYVGARNSGKMLRQFNKTDGWDDGTFLWNSNEGWAKSFNSSWYGWMFKRYKGMDVVRYEGSYNNAPQNITHNMNAVPKMVIVKCTSHSSNADWTVGHIGLDGGTAPWTHYLRLNSNGGEDDWDGAWDDTAPTSTTFRVGNGSNYTNVSGRTYIAYLFADANDVNDNPISKVGYVTGGGSSGTTVTLGFKPRFLLIKNTSGGWHWQLFDYKRGLGTATHQNDIAPNDRDAQDTGTNWVTATNTGFTSTNMDSGYNYIYYAHA